VSSIAAFVKPENQASVRLFQKSGFRQIGVERISGQTALHFVWDC
jgi:L-amino acid N-acyltransferase YncA